MCIVPDEVSGFARMSTNFYLLTLELRRRAFMPLSRAVEPLLHDAEAWCAPMRVLEPCCPPWACGLVTGRLRKLWQISLWPVASACS
eukprot:scaffold614_cov367-Prasinococcus_capsulatus_cf.AAC.6